MRTHRHLFERLIDPDHLDRAIDLAARGKRRRPDVAWMLFRRDSVHARLGSELRAGTWRPERFELFAIRDPKPRVIARAPIEDGVVHTALVDLLEPVFLPSMTSDAFACRPGMGTHRALLRVLGLVRRHRLAVHLDVRSYFASVDLEILRGLLARRVRDERFLAVVDLVLRSGRSLFDRANVRRAARMDPDWPPPGRGLPIGALTSQLFAAHVYLMGLDHHVKRAMKVPGYVRYVDDLVLFGDRRVDLRAWRSKIGRWIGEERGLRLKVPKARVLSCAGHLDVMGHRVTRRGIEPLPRTLARLRATVARESRRRCGEGPDLRRSVDSIVGGVLFG